MDKSSLNKLTQTTLAQRASAELIDFISVNGLNPGDTLPSEARMAEQLGGSRTVVREALHQLQGQGVLRMVNGRGAEVREVDSEILQVYFRHALRTLDRSLVELMEVRRGIEAESARLCAVRRTSKDLTELTSILEQMRATHQSNEYARLDSELHVAIARGSGNTVLLQLVLALRGGLFEVSVAGLARRKSAGSMQQIQLRHEEIVQAIVDGDGDAALRAMCNHMDEALSFLTDSVPELPPISTGQSA